jgi:integration host factor subunit alpha
MGAVSKQDIAGAVSDRLGYSKRSSMFLLDSLFELIKQGVNRGDVVKIVRFGLFYKKEKEPRKGVDPRTGSYITIPSKKTVVFKPSRILKRDINDCQPRKKIFQNRRSQQTDGA